MSWIYESGPWTYKPLKSFGFTVDDQAQFNVVYRGYVPPTPPEEHEYKIPMWVWILGALGGAYLLFTHGKEE